MARTIVIAAGGTAGHVIPALCVADELRSRGAEVLWIGGERAEAELVPAAGYELRPIRVRGLSRTDVRAAAGSAALAARALIASRAILREVGADAVLGGGGYVAGPVGLAAVALRVPLVLTEADSELGLANRALARWARRVCLAFPLEGRTGERYRVTGRPVPLPVADRGAARATFGIAKDEDFVVVFGGSLGARSINEAAVAGLADAPFSVLHLTGSRDYRGLSERPIRPHYDLRESLPIERFEEALAASDLVVARAGGSIFEIAAQGRPAILVPYPHATADHQTRNARWMADGGAAVIVPDDQLDGPRLAREVGALLADRGRLAAMARASAALARPRAASDVADEVLAAAGADGDASAGVRSPGRALQDLAVAVERPWDGRELHVVGVGGAGMSGLALLAAGLGARVTGSDQAQSAYLERVREAGIEAVAGHRAENLPAGERVEVVYSTAVPADNPELVAARERGLAVLHRSELLARLSALRPTIAVAGTHGKTTTSSMVVHALRGAGMDPAYLIGGELRSTGTNAAWGSGEWLVVEADESDRSMLALRRDVAVVLNVELDHHATFGSIAELREAFAAFLAQAGEAVVWDRPELLALRPGPVVPFDVGEVELGPQGSRFAWRDHEVALAVPGRHNALDAVAALEACRLAGADPAAAATALADFSGAGRRFERLGATASGAELYDDYAHHPTEVRATLEAARTLRPRRLVVAFQPHLYSRTAALAGDFGRSLAAADVIVVLDVYRARERPEDHPGVSGRLIAQAAADAAPGKTVAWLPGIDDAERYLRTTLREGDLCLVVGAGNVDALGRRLVDRERPSAGPEEGLAAAR
jgi:UDP-N-acetylmuramate--alanine ligase